MLTQRLLQHKNFHVLEGLYYISPASAICSLLIAAVMELHSLDSRAVIASLPSTWPLYATNMLLGFLVNGPRAHPRPSPSPFTLHPHPSPFTLHPHPSPSPR